MCEDWRECIADLIVALLCPPSAVHLIDLRRNKQRAKTSRRIRRTLSADGDWSQSQSFPLPNAYRDEDAMDSKASRKHDMFARLPS